MRPLQTRALGNARHAAVLLSEQVFEVESLEALARAANISLAWLRDGTGSMDDAPPASPADDGAVPSLTRALLTAWRASGAEPEDFQALDAVCRRGAPMLRALPDEEAVTVMRTWLAAARRLRLAGKPVTFETLAWELGSHRPDNDDGRKELADLGAAPPVAPIRTKKT